MNVRIETGLRSTTVPADRYHQIFSAEGTLVGSRTGFLSGFVRTGCDTDRTCNPFDDPNSLPDFLRALLHDIDSVLPEPVEGKIQRIDYAGHVLTFRPAVDMGYNHAGWFDGFFLIPDALFQKIRAACAQLDLNFDPDRAIFDFDSDTLVSLDCDYENVDPPHFCVSFNGVSPLYDDVRFAGTIPLM